MELFRDNALRRLATPVETTQLVRIVTPAHLAAALGLTLMIAAALVWGALGRVNFTAEAQGIFLRADGLTEVVAPERGRVRAVLVDVGDLVDEGQTVALVEQPELALEVEHKQAELRQARRLHERTRAAEAAILERQLDALASERDGAAAARASDRARESWLARKQADERALIDAGVGTRYEVEELETSRNLARADAKSKTAQIATTQSRALEAEWRREAAIRASALGVEAIERELELLRERLDRAERVVAPVAGRVVELNTRVGAAVERGTPVIRLERPEREDARLHAVLFFRATDAKALSVGALVRLHPAGIREREHGSLLGRVTKISLHPGTRSAMRAILGNEDLVDEYSASGSPFVVEVEPIPDPSTISGYRWTAGLGPPAQIESGSVCSATALTEQRAPLSLLVPYVRTLIFDDDELPPPSSDGRAEP